MGIGEGEAAGSAVGEREAGMVEAGLGMAAAGVGTAGSGVQEAEATTLTTINRTNKARRYIAVSILPASLGQWAENQSCL